MDTSPHYLSLADMSSQQCARLMCAPRPQALADDMNRLERSAQ
jgi:hypothetical protein